MAYYPQYSDGPSWARHSSTADDLAIAAAFQEELDQENRINSKPRENTLRDSDIARRMQQEENAKAEGTFKVVYDRIPGNQRLAYRKSADYNDFERNIPGVKFGDVLKGTAVRGHDGLAYIRLDVAGAKLYLPATTADKKVTLIQKVAGHMEAAAAKPQGPTTIARNKTYRVLYPRGCAFRKTASWADRNTKDAPAECGAIVSGNVIRGTDGVNYLNIAPGFFLPIATADGKTIIMEDVNAQAAPVRPAVPAPVQASVPAPQSEPVRRETLSHHQAAGSMRDSEFARILQAEEESRAGVKPGSCQVGARSVPAAAAAPRPSAQWEEIQDGQGRTYYWNKATNETSWTKPGVSSTSAALNNDITRISQGIQRPKATHRPL